MKKTFKFTSIQPEMVNHRESSQHPSLVTPGGSTALKKVPVYTGNAMIGISVIHKSCLQPIFSKQAAIDAASMRR